jgi:uncharacterized protein (TIGR03643 family)
LAERHLKLPKATLYGLLADKTKLAAALTRKCLVRVSRYWVTAQFFDTRITMDRDSKQEPGRCTERPTVEALNEMIEMALSDRVSFSQIQAVFGFRSNDVKRLMRTHLRRGSYIAWRKRVRDFTARRNFYK